ncbi:CotH kinase family protein [Liquorilactobacillus uvarum]|uniref:CotH kinase family protein n=1 Tax=Liquorilactobacillus uvarum TaxID=303240 RepID=UPI00070DBDDF|nr:CotH kinase family protein [Liquorilactobacillus uvarum]
MKNKHIPHWLIFTLVSLTLLVICYCLYSQQDRQLPQSASSTVDLPTVKLTGPLTNLEAHQKKVIKFRLKKANGKKVKAYAKIRLQGQHSLKFPEKNYAVTLYSGSKCKHKLSVKLQSGWRKSSKYVLKANYTDSTSARNLVSADLWSDFVRFDSNHPSQLKSKNNFGAVQGFPVTLKINGDYHGLYTLTTAKGRKLWGMSKKDSSNIAIRSNGYSRNTLFYQSVAKFDEKNWQSLSPSKLSDQQQKSVNRFVSFISNSSVAQFKQNAHRYLNIPMLINYYIFTNLTHNQDGAGRNMIYLTNDNQHWYPIAYDLDATWGLYENGKILYPSARQVRYNYPNGGDLRSGEGNRLLQLVAESFPQEIQARWHFLRKDIVTTNRINNKFKNAMLAVGENNYQDNFKVNSNIPSKKITNLEQLNKAVKRQISENDQLFNNFTKNVHQIDFNYTAPLTK